MYKISLSEVRKRGREGGREERCLKKQMRGTIPRSWTVTVNISPKLFYIFSAIAFKTPMGCFLRSWQNNYKFHLKSNCGRMGKNFPLRKTKMNHSKREVMISCTHFQTRVGWEPGSAPRSPSPSCGCSSRGRRGFLSVARVRVHRSTASRGWASPRKERSEARCVREPHRWAWELALGTKTRTLLGTRVRKHTPWDSSHFSDGK